MAPRHRQFLRVKFEERLYQFRVLLLGLSLALQIFNRCATAALSPQSIRILPFLDDWLICSATRKQAIHDITSLLNHVTQLGPNVNFEKSCLIPSQRVTFIRITLDSVVMRASPSSQRVSDILNFVSNVWRGTRLTFGLFLSHRVRCRCGSMVWASTPRPTKTG